MLSAGFEPAIPAEVRLQTYTFDCTATGIGITKYYRTKYLFLSSSNYTQTGTNLLLRIYRVAQQVF
jgi:hypothetical protein